MQCTVSKPNVEEKVFVATALTQKEAKIEAAVKAWAFIEEEVVGSDDTLPKYVMSMEILDRLNKKGINIFDSLCKNLRSLHLRIYPGFFNTFE